MDEIVLGIDSLSNIASCNHEKYINFVEKCSPIYIETSGGLVVVRKSGIVVLCKTIGMETHYTCIPMILPMKNKTVDLILSMSLVEYILKWIIDWTNKTISVNEVWTMDVTVEKGLYLARANVLNRDEVARLVSAKDVKLIRALQHAHSKSFSPCLLNVGTNVQHFRDVTSFDNTDWAMIIAERRKLDVMFGPFGVEVCYDFGKNNVLLGRKVVKDFRSENLSDDAFWIHGPYKVQILIELAEKAIDGFYLSPQNTKFIFIGPDEPGFGHQRLLDSECKRVCTWEKGTVLFSIPNRKHFIPEKTVYDSDGRVIIKGTPFKIVAWYKDIATAPNIDKMSLYVARTGHPSEHDTRYHVEHELNVAGIKLKKSDRIPKTNNCPICLRARYRRENRVSIGRDMTKYEIFEYMAVDIHGPLFTPARDGSRYVIGFMCMRSSFDIVFPIARKELALNALQQLLIVIRQFGYAAEIKFYIREMKSDDDSVFKSKAFEKLLADNYAVHQIAAPYDHEKMAVREGRWWFLMSKTRAIMIQMEVPNDLWHLAVTHACMLINAFHPVAKNGYKSSYEAVFNKPFDLPIYIFYSKCLSFIDATKRRKEDDRAFVGRYVGTSMQYKCLKVYKESSNIVLLRSMVKVIEDLRALSDNNNVGKLLKMRHLDVWDDQVFREFATPLDVSETTIFTSVKSIIEFKAFFDEGSQVFYGTVVVEYKNAKTERVYLYSLLMSSALNNELYRESMRYLDDFNKFYPIGACINVKRRGKELPGVVVSIDPNSKRTVQVVFNDCKTIDVPDSEISEFADSGTFMCFTNICFYTSDNVNGKPLGPFAPNNFEQAKLRGLQRYIDAGLL